MAADKTYGFGLIGAGAISTMHAQVVDALPNARLAGITAIPVEAARDLAAKHRAWAFESVEELLADPEVDVVALGTPSGLHPEQVEAAARAGKHVICEKPVAVSLDGADRAIRAAEEAGVRLGVISQRRFDPVCVALKRAIDTGEFGRLILINGVVRYFREQHYYSSSNWRGTWKLDGGGALINQGIHTVDLVRWLGGRVRSVSGFARTLSHEIEVEDTAAASIEFENGALGTLQSTTSAAPGLYISLEVMGDKGSAVLQDSDITFWKTLSSDEPPVIDGPKTGSGTRDPMAFSPTGHISQFADFLQALDDGRAPAIDGREGRDTLELVLAVYQSSRTGSVVSLPLQSDN